MACIQSFPLRARLGFSVAPFPASAASHAACGFTALRAPAQFAARVMRRIKMGRLPKMTDARLGTHRRVPRSHTAIPRSTASIRSPGAERLGPGGAESSFLPSLGCTRSTCAPQKLSPVRRYSRSRRYSRRSPPKTGLGLKYAIGTVCRWTLAGNVGLRTGPGIAVPTGE